MFRTCRPLIEDEGTRSGLGSRGITIRFFVNGEGGGGLEIGTRDASHAVVSTERLMAL